jgi:uncharacterized protein (DUF1684 family)
MDSEYRRRLEEQRRKREEYFADHPHSPVPSDQFAGLEYYPVDRSYRFELALQEHDEKETLTVETSTGGRQEYLRWGEFQFEVGGETRTLQAYRADADESRLWVPFRDETNGEETYGAGRYLDLEPDSHRTADGWVLDFNEAYNPTCAYSEVYECPLTPMENWLEIRIEAGEKAYPGDPVEHSAHN